MRMSSEIILSGIDLTSTLTYLFIYKKQKVIKENANLHIETIYFIDRSECSVLRKTTAILLCFYM